MTIIVEDGSNIAEANSYVSVAEFTAFLSSRNLEVTDGTEESLLILANDVLEQQSYKGNKTTTGQALSFPRTRIADTEGNEYSDDAIPLAIKQAQLWLAYYLDTNNLSERTSPEISQKTTDVLTTKFAVNPNGQYKQNTIHQLPNVINVLRHLLRRGSVTQQRVIRA